MKNPIISLIDFLETRKVLNLLLVFTYGFGVIFLHDRFVQLSILAMNDLGLPAYNQAVQLIILIGGGIVCLTLVWSLTRNRANFIPKAIFLSLTLIFLGIHYLFMFEMNIEIIHVLEFSILAFLLFPLTKSIGASVIYSLPFMILNELYQYLVLYPHYIKYFELNDIVLDLLGCGLMLISLWVLGSKPKCPQQVFWKRSSMLMLMGILLFTLIGVATCFLALYTTQACDNSIFIFNQVEEPQPFWSTHYYGAVYHILKPIEGVVLVLFVCLFYVIPDYLITPSKK